MKLWLRLLWVLLSWRNRGYIDIWKVGRRTFRVWPTDIDIFRHMNNGIYLTLLDVARFDLLKRSGSWAALKRVGIHPVVVAETVSFRKSLTLGQEFDIETAVVGWNDIAFFIEQRFVVGGEIYAKAIVRLRFLKSPKGTPTPLEVIDAMGGWHAPVPVLPKWIGEWESAIALPKGKEPAPSIWDRD